AVCIVCRDSRVLCTDARASELYCLSLHDALPILPPSRPLGSVLCGCPQPQMGGIRAAVEVAGVADDGILSGGPSRPSDHAVGQLVGEEVSWDRASAGRPRQAGGAE